MATLSPVPTLPGHVAEPERRTRARTRARTPDARPSAHQFAMKSRCSGRGPLLALTYPIVTDTLPISAPNTALEQSTAFLTVAFQAENALAAASRHALHEVTSVMIGRGEGRTVNRSAPVGAHALTLLLPDSRLSQQHTRLEWDCAGWTLVDAGSKNGSFVNGERVSRRPLKPGDVIELGGTFLVYQQGSFSPYQPRDLTLTPAQLTAFSTLNPKLAIDLQRLQQGSRSMMPVLLRGETGTGKEICARAIHALSGRSGPFVAVNCGAIPAQLVEAQLFGFVKGAFTGADRGELGLIRAAEGGTLLLDEIGDLPASSQAALLRVLQNSEVTPVGGSVAVRVNVRILSATHQPLERLIARGDFRNDLFARLAGFEVTLSPLRERREDLGLLISQMLSRHGLASLRGSTARALFLHAWPHNIRELEHCLGSSSVLAGTQPIAPEHLPVGVRQAMHPTPAPESEPDDGLTPDDEELRARVVAILEATGGNVSEAARRMGKARQQLQRWVRRFKLDATAFSLPQSE
jgi:transcriptional regulator with AAA-type ATPase domain